MSTHATIAIIAWKKLSRRSELLAKALDSKLWFFADNVPYLRASLNTLRYALSQKPRIIVAQLPQGPLLLEALIVKKLIGCKVVADAHTGFLVNSDWKGRLLNAPFVKLLTKADLVIAHNKPQLDLIPARVRNKTLVVFDPWYVAIDRKATSKSALGGYIVFPASFASDEPLEEIINSINSLNINVKMYVTGNWKRQPEIKKYASDRVVFTGFLPIEKFDSLIARSTAIITGTKREYTTLMSGWEAVAYNKPLALTATSTLKSLFRNYAVFYDWKNSQSIARAIEKILRSEPNVVTREELKKKTVAGVEALREKLRGLIHP
jgi:hypothetical protein